MVNGAFRTSRHRHICTHTRARFNSIRMACACTRARMCVCASACVKDNEIKSRHIVRRKACALSHSTWCDSTELNIIALARVCAGVRLSARGRGRGLGCWNEVQMWQTPRPIFAYFFSVKGKTTQNGSIQEYVVTISMQNSDQFRCYKNLSDCPSVRRRSYNGSLCFLTRFSRKHFFKVVFKLREL